MADPKIKEVEAQANQTAKRDSEALADQVDVLRKDLATITEMMSEMGLRRKDETLAAARERMERLRSEGEARYNDARAYANDTYDQTLDAVRRQPGTALGIAIAVGFFAGLLTRK